MTNSKEKYNYSTVEVRPFEKLDWVFLLTAAMVWGSSFLFMDIALESEHPGLVTWLRPIFGAAALFCFPAARRPIERSDYLHIFILGFTWMAFPLTMFPLAQQWIDSSVTGMLNGAMPIMTLILGVVAFGLKIQKVQVIGLLIGSSGICMIGLPTLSAGGSNAIGVLFVILAVFSYGIAVHLAGPLQRKYGSLAVLLRVMIVALIFSAPFGVYGFFQSEWSGKSFGANLAVGLGGTGIAYVAAATLNGRVGAVRTSIVTYLIPIVALLLGVFVLEEKLSIWELLGVSILITGAWLTTRTVEQNIDKKESV